MRTKAFLQIGGAILVLIAVLGFVGVLGPTPDASVFGDSWWFDRTENWTHLAVGAVALVSSFIIPIAAQRPFVLLLGVATIGAAVYGIFIPVLFGANLENPSDTLLHLAVGIWAIWSSGKSKNSDGVAERRRG